MFGVLIIAAWFVVAICGIGWMGREQALAAEKNWDQARGALRKAPGWTMRHELPHDARIAAAIGGHLLARGRVPGLREEILVAGELMEPSLENRLRDAGWLIERPDAPMAEGSLTIFSPDNAPRWRGVYQNSDFAFGPPLLRDDAVLAAVLSGERFPPLVPSACSAGPARSPVIALFQP